MVIYTWTPSTYVTELIPGENVVWLAVDDVIDDSNPLGVDGGEGHSQLPGTARIDADQCPAAADHPEGLCQMGWIAADIKVTANNEFLAGRSQRDPTAWRAACDGLEHPDLAAAADGCFRAAIEALARAGTPALAAEVAAYHDRYVARGYMTPDPSGTRIGWHQSLSSTRVYVARDAGRSDSTRHSSRGPNG